MLKIIILALAAVLRRVWISRSLGDWRCHLAIVQPETAICWHRLGWRLYWRRKNRRRRPGRPNVAIEFPTVPTATFQVLYVLVVLSMDRRRIVHFNVTDPPTTE